MSKYKAFKCDICGDEMQDNGRLLVKRRHIIGCIEGEFKEWKRLDVCAKCQNEMIAWIRGRRDYARTKGTDEIPV